MPANNRLERTASLSARSRREHAVIFCALAPRMKCWRAAAQPERCAQMLPVIEMFAGCARRPRSGRERERCVLWLERLSGLHRLPSLLFS